MATHDSSQYCHNRLNGPVLYLATFSGCRHFVSATPGLTRLLHPGKSLARRTRAAAGAQPNPPGGKGRSVVGQFILHKHDRDKGPPASVR